MALTRFQNTEEIQKDLKILSNQLEVLRKNYEQYFLGILREQPVKMRADVQRIINKHFGVPIQNASLKFLLAQCISRYNTYSAYWDRILREMEEGTYKRDVFKTKLHEKERLEKEGIRPIAKSKTEAANKKDVYENLFEEYKELRKQLKQETKNLSFDTFKNQLKSKIGDLGAKGEGYSFKVVQEDKEIKIKLQKKKPTSNS